MSREIEAIRDSRVRQKAHALTRVADEIENLEGRLTEAKARRLILVTELQREGLSERQIALHAGVSNVRVHQLLTASTRGGGA